MHIAVSRTLTRVVCQFLSKNTRNALLRTEGTLFCYPRIIEYNKKSNMAQKSITSFFKFTPKKSPDVKTEIAEKDNSVLNSSNETDDTAVATLKAKEKRSSKRARLDSSSSDSQSPKEASQTPLVDNKSKKKAKRQRIESSDSESDSPKNNKNDKLDLKVEVNKSLKAYSSPKTKISEEVKVKKEKSKSPSPVKKEPKSPVKSAEKNSRNSLTGKSKNNDDGDKKAKTDNETDSKSTSKSLKNSKVLREKLDNVKKEDSTKEDVQIVPESEYNPGKAKYHPIKDACWTTGQDVPYLALARTLEQIEGTSGRLRMVEILSNYFRSVIVLTPQDLLPSVYMCLNQLAPAYHSLELGIAETYIMKAIGQCTGRTLAQVKSAAQKTGDLGLVAEQARATQRTMFTPPPLKLRSVFGALKEIAHMTGQASVNKKIAKIQSLYVACRFSEARYLIRSLEGKLRVGLAEQSVLQALAQATAYTPPDPNGVKVLDASKGISADEFKARLDENALIIKTTYCECPNYELVIPVLLQHGVNALPEHCRLTPGVPLKPMLAHPTRGVHEVFNRFEGELFTCEWKYDGERAQIHVPSSEDDKPDLAKASIFSRNQENNTSKYPDVLGRLKSLLKDDVKSCVLDCEAVAYDTVNKQIQPFQILSTRKRKDAVDSEIKVQVCVFVFDLLYLNGRPLVREPLVTRRELLRKHFNEVEGEWQFATAKDCSSMDEVQQFLDEAVRGSCEGLMVKTLHGDRAHYDIARRSRNWLKLKKDYVEGVGDSLDIVVIGAYKGRGKRAGVFGGFLLACYDPDTEEYQSICKIGTGFSDEDLQTLTKTLEEHVIDSPKNYYRYDNSHAADVWVEPRCVWEVRCADLSLSPVHRAAIGLVQPDKGISLRFPRFIRVRDDKSPEQATSARQISQMYLSQDQVKNQTGKLNDQDDFY